MGATAKQGIDVGAPSYRIVIDYVTRMIAAGEWRPGQQLPTIRELADATGTNPTAVKNAMMVLHATGHVRGQQGKGNFVANPQPPV